MGEKSTNSAKLESVIATLVILKSRLTPTFRRDVDACLEWIDQVEKNIRKMETFLDLNVPTWRSEINEMEDENGD